MSSSDALQREILPIPHRPFTGLTPYDAKDPEAKFPPIEPLRPPKSAPNVLVVLLDDVGFGASSAFGGPCSTPTAERLARGGLKYNRFHTTALCSPTRAALLTGRNHHTVGMGAVADVATGAPGYNSIRPNSCAPLAEILKLNGYSTAQFGKCHEVPVWETSPLGPFTQWPTGSGFEYFYGFIGGETNQWYPGIYEGTTPLEPPKTPEEGYHFTVDMTDKAIAWIRQQKSLMPDKPFFVYFAPGATHAPHHVPKEWADKYKGRFDDGWDVLRQETFERQKNLGVIPKDAVLTPRPKEIPAWDEMPADLKAVLVRQMEVYAGFLEHVDHHVGRLVDALSDLELLDDTLVLYSVGDNGASAEGTINGTFNEVITLFNGGAGLETAEFLNERIDEFGGPTSYNHFAVGWAHAMDTPYQWTKQVASHWGGTRNGLVVHWPHRIRSSGEIRPQFHHAIDVAPTILEAAGLPEPVMVNGVAQIPMAGVSMMYSFDDGAAADRHETQYFEMVCNRGIYHKGWTAITRHSTPWISAPSPALDDDVWELYDTTTDWTQAHDLSKEMPEKLEELKRLWLIEAVKYNVLPLDDRRFERFDAAVAGRPVLAKGKSQILFGGMGRLPENCVISVKNKSFSVTAEVSVPPQGAGGVIVAQGGAFGGWALYAIDGKPRYCHNWMGLRNFTIAGDAALAEGTHQVRLEFKYDGGGLGKGGDASLYVDGKKCGEGRVDATVPIMFSGDETTDIGYESGTPVSTDYTVEDSRFTGAVHWVQIDLGGEDEDHLISPEERLKVVMARQ